MKNKMFLPFFITTFLLSGYPSFNVAQANPSILIAQSIWKPFSSQEGGFSVLMPGQPTQEKRIINTKEGSLPSNIFSVIRENEAVYRVAYLDFSTNISQNNRDINKSLSDITAGFAEGAGGRLVSQRSIQLRNFPGREIRLQFEQGLIGRGRLYFVNKRWYIVIALTNKERSLTKSIEGFLNSFQLLNNSAAPAKPSIEELNASLKQAVCSQNWSQSLKVIDQMIAIAPSPEVRSQLVTYRSQLQGLANSGSKIPPQSLPECATGT